VYFKRPEFAWVRASPGALVFGEMFQLPMLDIVYGILFLPSVLTYSAVSLRMLVLLNFFKFCIFSQTNRIKFMIGALYTFFLPLFAFFLILKFGLPTSNPNVHSV
ncbi:hypothetical protein PFISCL1PPCAC_13775, partial [Pristionchus fissidentatus]